MDGAAAAGLPLIQTFPNPFNRSLTVRFNGAAEKGVLFRVYDIRGREVMRKKLMRRRHMVLDGSALNGGLYVILAQSGNRSFARKVFLQK